MTVKSHVVTVTTTATQLTAGGAAIMGRSLMVYVPSGGQTVKLGGPDLTWANGYPVAAGASYGADMQMSEVLYAIVQAGSQDVNCVWSGV